MSFPLTLAAVLQVPSEAIEDRWGDLERAVDQTPSIDRWCSGPDWVYSAAAAFSPMSKTVLLEHPGAGFALLAKHTLDDGGLVLAGMEPLWGFASPVFGQDLAAVAESLSRWLQADPSWGRLVLPGLPEDGTLLRTLARPLSRIGELGVAEGITRQVIDLSDGHDAWLQSRRPSFRRNLRNASRRAADVGMTFCSLDESPGITAGEVFDRIHTIESKSWKGKDGDGITSPDMAAFYTRLIDRLLERGRLRMTVAQIDGRDVGYIIGGIRQGRYRGLQLSYVQEHRSLSISHLLQRHQVTELASSGVETYDMGMDMEYKQRWANRQETSVVLVLDRL